MRVRALVVAATALSVSACSSGYNCENKKVQDRVLAILRANFFNVLAGTNQPAFKAIAMMGGVAGLSAGISEIAKNDANASSQTDLGIRDKLDAFKASAAFSFASVTEEANDRKSGTFGCRAKVRIEASIPPELPIQLFQVDQNGKVVAHIDTRFSISPDPRRMDEFLVDARW
jgi:hypothetical protein